jgi:DNA adenine methylase
MFFSRTWPGAVIADANLDLVNAYQCVRDDVAEVIRWLEVHAGDYAKSPEQTFERVRSSESKHALAEAARFIFLNKTCFNGLYRVNAKGAFNVPFGRYKNPTICDKATLRRCARMLRGAEVLHESFQTVLKRCGRGDFVYCDPPYLGTYDGYTVGGFDEKKHVRLRECADGAVKRGAIVLVTNADNSEVRRIWAGGGWKVREVQAPQQIAASGEKRTPRKDLIIFRD